MTVRYAWAVTLIVGCSNCDEADRNKAALQAPPAPASKQKWAYPTIKTRLTGEGGPSAPSVGARYVVKMELTNEGTEPIDGFDVHIMGAADGFVLTDARPTGATTEVVGSLFVVHYFHSIQPGKKVGAVFTLTAKKAGNYTVLIELSKNDRVLVDAENETEKAGIQSKVAVLP